MEDRYPALVGQWALREAERDLLHDEMARLQDKITAYAAPAGSTGALGTGDRDFWVGWFRRTLARRERRLSKVTAEIAALADEIEGLRREDPSLPALDSAGDDVQLATLRERLRIANMTVARLEGLYRKSSLLSREMRSACLREVRDDIAHLEHTIRRVQAARSS